MLGPLELFSNGQPVTLGAPKQKIVLALLLARANTTVSIEQVIDELWDDSPPASAVANVRTYAANLRRLLAARPDLPALVKRGPGYVLEVDTAELDLAHFRRLAQAAREALLSGDPRAVTVCLDEALALWRGDVLADIRTGRWLTDWRTAIQEERLSALELRIEALLGSGAYDQAATQAHELLSIDPLREHTHALLMHARYEAGDIAGALAGFDRARRRLVEQLGIEPGEELRRLQQAVLERRDLRSSRYAPEPPALVVPRQLPADLRGFTGRSDLLRRLDDKLNDWLHTTEPAGNVVAVSGMAGVGKTALAVRWAHEVAHRFPDGQLYVNLRGFDPSGNARSSAEVLPAFLEALGARPEQTPAGPEAQAGLYRSLLAGRRMLIVLDNARDTEQVRPLIPGAPGSLVLVTSRDQLIGLVAVDDAYPLSVDVLTAAESGRLLADRLGADRIAADPASAGELVRLCAGLPLALVIVAARAATQAGFTLRELADELRAERAGLDAFETGEETADIRAVFSWSYRTLDPEAARLFRLLGRKLGPDCAEPAAASLLGHPIPQVRPLLAKLTRAHLLTEHRPGRYAFHDLVRVYATELAAQHDTEPERHRAELRLLDHYLHSAGAASRLLSPHRNPIDLPGPIDGVTVHRPDNAADAFAWFQAEHAGLLAAVEQAGAAGHDSHVWQLAWAVSVFLNRRGHWPDQVRVQSAAVAAPLRTGDPVALANAHRLLASAYSLSGRWAEAHATYSEALGWFARLDDRAGEALTHRNLAWLCEQQGQDKESLEHNLRALELFQAMGLRSGEARAYNGIGWDHARLGDYRQAIAYCEQAVALNQELGDEYGLAVTLDSLGYAHHRLGDLDRAIDCFERAARLIQGAGDRNNAAEIFEHLGDSRYAAGSLPAAAAAWRRALDALEELGHPSADRIRAKLRRNSAGG